MTSIYSTLSEHQTTHGWDRRDLFRELHRWAKTFDCEFKLNIPELAICVDLFRRSRFGHFRAGPNGFGLSSEVGINQLYLADRPFFEVLGTLLHEELHAWQHAHGEPGRGNYHNKEFRAKAKSLGLIIDAGGVTEYATSSPFTELLERHGIEVPDLPPSSSQTRLHHTSKLRKWSCHCTNVRVAIADFRALCLKCNHEFERVSS